MNHNALPSSSALTPHQRWMRLCRQVVLVTAACGGILVLSVWLMDFSPNMPWRALVALLPMLAVALLVWMFIKIIRNTDERHQQIERLSINITAITVPSLWFGAGLLRAADVIDVPIHLALFLVLPTMFLAYGIIKVVVMWYDLRER